MTELSKVEKSNKTPSARLGLSYESSVQPTSSSSFFSNPFNRFKIAFLTVVVIGGIGGYFYSDRVIDGFKSLGEAASNVSHEKNWVEGMMTQTNGVPEDDDKDGTLMPPRLMEENVVPVADELPTNPGPATDILPSEPVPASAAAVPAPAAVPVAKATAPEVKAPKAAKTSKKTKATKAKAKSKAKAKTKKSAQK